MRFPFFKKKQQRFRICHALEPHALCFQLVNSVAPHQRTPLFPPLPRGDRRGVRFAPDEAQISRVEDWLKAPEQFPLEPTSETSLAILLQLVESNIAEVNAGRIEVPYAHIHQIPDDERGKLGLPTPYPFSLELRSNGTLGDSTFSYDLRYIGANGRACISARRIGAFVRFSSDEIYLLDHETYLLTEAVERFNALPTHQRSFEQNLLAFAEIKALTVSDRIKFDAYLENENVVAPGRIRVELNLVDSDTLEVKPLIDSEMASAFSEKFDHQRTASGVYHFDRPNGERQRLLFDEAGKAALQEVKQHRVLKGRAKEAFLDAPREFLRSDAFDLDDLSERVRAIGAYRVRFYPFTRPKPGSWLPEIGFMIESDDPDAEIVHLPVASLEELDMLRAAYTQAEATGRTGFEFGGHRFPIDASTSEKLDQVRETLLKLSVEPEPASVEVSPAADKKFLLIYDNIEEIEYHGAGGDDWGGGVAYIPRALKEDIYLYPHQHQGVGWLQFLMGNGYHGGLLADDMGLGKTLQVLTFLAWYFETQPDPKTALIVAPVALLVNWEEEYRKFFHTEGLGEVLALHGSNLARFKLADAPSGREYGMDTPRPTLDVSAIMKHRLVLTTYEAVRDYQFSIALADWGVIVADEAQKVKTPGALVTNALKAVKTDFAIATTATPVENSLLDLWCIVDFVQPGYLGSLKRFTQDFVVPLATGEASRDALSDTLREKLKTIMVRRIKEDILKDLPEKAIHTHHIEMGNVQYERYLQEVQAALQAKQYIGQSPVKMLSVLANLRAICAHPILVDGGDEALTATKLLADSTKLVSTVERLKQIQGDEEKVILFERSRQMQRILQRVIRAVFSFSPAIINGDVPGIVPKRSRKFSRKMIIDQFQATPGFNVIIMSPEAAGVGLTITEANHVIHYTRLWNPAKEEQATDRVYRIGQKRDVHVHYMLSIAPNSQFETFDVKLDRLLHEKRSLSRDFLIPTEQIDVQPQALMDAVFNEMETMD